MGNLTRAERERLIAQDDGDPDGTVVVGTPVHDPGRCYHRADAECRNNQCDGRISLTRQQAQRRSLYPCRYCVLEDVDSAENLDYDDYNLLANESVTSIDDIREVYPHD